MSPVSDHVVGGVRVYFLRLIDDCTVGMDRVSLIHSPADGHLGFVHILAIENNTAANVSVKTSLGAPVFGFLGHGPRSEIAAGLGSSIFSFSRKPAAFSTATAPPCRPADGTRECRFPLPPQPALASWVPLVAALLGVAGASFAVFTHVSE